MSTRTFCIATVAVALILFGLVEAKDMVPLVLEGDELLDACSGVGEIGGLHSDGDGFVAVRAGPGKHYKMVDQLINGDRVYICRSRENWLGVVYSKAGRNCQISSPVSKTQKYTGPCAWGWIYRKWVLPRAG